MGSGCMCGRCDCQGLVAEQMMIGWNVAAVRVRDVHVKPSEVKTCSRLCLQPATQLSRSKLILQLCHHELCTPSMCMLPYEAGIVEAEDFTSSKTQWYIKDPPCSHVSQYTSMPCYGCYCSS